MKVHLESTTKIVTVLINGVEVPARIWEGKTESGIRCFAMVTRIWANSKDDLSEFDRELAEQ